MQHYRMYYTNGALGRWGVGASGPWGLVALGHLCSGVVVLWSCAVVMWFSGTVVVANKIYDEWQMQKALHQTQPIFHS